MKKISNFFNEKILNKIRITSKTKTKVSLFISIIGLLCLIVGSSFALLTETYESTNKQVIDVGKVKLILTESKEGINLDNLIEMTDEEGFNQSDYYSFSISNIGDTPAEYDLLLVSDTTKESTLDEKFIKVGLEVNNDKVEIVNLKDANNIIHSTVISKNEDIDYKLRIWIDPDVLEDDSVEENETISLKLKVNATQYMGESNLKNTAYNTIKSQVKTMNISYKYINDKNITENGITYNNGDNGVFLFDGTDDNGGSLPIYYYRGNVDNNVIFANMCWKIVRTTSTGGIKLIYNGLPDETGTCSNTGTASQLSSTSKFNSGGTSPADVGYMYGTKYTNTSKDMSSVTDEIMYGNDVTYSNGVYTLSEKTITSTSFADDKATIANGYHYTCLNSTGVCDEDKVYYISYYNSDSSLMYYLTFTGGDTLETAKEKMFTNTTDSTIKIAIDAWYSTNLASYTNMLENAIFCNDRSFASGTLGGSLSDIDTNSISYSSFSSYQRLYETYSPSLQCINQKDQFSLKETNGGTSGYGNNSLTYPVGLLTADEDKIAGGGSSNSNYYLYTGENYWELTPYRFYSASYVKYPFYSNYSSGDTSLSRGVRPVVSLQLGTEFEAGTDGTTSNPYVVKVS